MCALFKHTGQRLLLGGRETDSSMGQSTRVYFVCKWPHLNPMVSQALLEVAPEHHQVWSKSQHGGQEETWRLSNFSVDAGLFFFFLLVYFLVWGQTWQFSELTPDSTFRDRSWGAQGTLRVAGVEASQPHSRQVPSLLPHGSVPSEDSCVSHPYTNKKSQEAPKESVFRAILLSF